MGGLMQTAGAFGEVQNSLSYLVNSFTDIANWKAVSDRLSGFNDSIYYADLAHAPAENMHVIVGEQQRIDARNITLRLPDGKVLLENINLSVAPGDRLLITGISGVGKSTLLRLLSGIWPFAQGSLTQPDHAHTLFVPQKPYLPLGTLRQALCYPSAPDIGDEQLHAILSLCELDALSNRLDEPNQWSQVLSLGEQQRVAFARILIAHPDFIFLDEATSALDEKAEAYFYAMLKEKLPQAAVVSVGHRGTLREWHTREMVLGAATA
jgi:putative ATP-binding cassette transporter